MIIKKNGARFYLSVVQCSYIRRWTFTIARMFQPLTITWITQVAFLCGIFHSDHAHTCANEFPTWITFNCHFHTPNRLAERSFSLKSLPVFNDHFAECSRHRNTRFDFNLNLIIQLSKVECANLFLSLIPFGYNEFGSECNRMIAKPLQNNCDYDHETIPNGYSSKWYTSGESFICKIMARNWLESLLSARKRIQCEMPLEMTLSSRRFSTNASDN